MSKFSIFQRLLSDVLIKFSDKSEECMIFDEFHAVHESLESLTAAYSEELKCADEGVRVISSQIREVPTSNGSVNDCERKCKAMELRLVDLEEEVTSRCNELNDLEVERGQLCADLQELEKLSDSRQNRYLVDLYRSTTNVRFDFDAEPNKVVGFVAGPNHVATFDMDTNENSQYFITNKIWELMVPVHKVH